MRSILTRPMRFTLAVVLLLGVASTISVAQNSVGKVHKSTAGKGTKADLSHHRDKSALVLHQNTSKNGPASELNKIEQQSLHAGSSYSSHPGARVKSAPLPNMSAAKGDRNPSINFNGRSAGGNHTVTNSKKSSGIGCFTELSRKCWEAFCRLLRNKKPPAALAACQRPVYGSRGDLTRFALARPCE